MNLVVKYFVFIFHYEKYAIPNFSTKLIRQCWILITKLL